jgi:hypothetical protein
VVLYVCILKHLVFKYTLQYFIHFIQFLIRQYFNISVVILIHCYICIYALSSFFLLVSLSFYPEEISIRCGRC